MTTELEDRPWASGLPGLTPEARLLFVAAAPAQRSDSVERTREAIASVRSWPGLLRLALRHEVVFQLHRSLAQAAADLPPGILALLEDQRRRQELRGRRAWGELREALGILAASGVSAMPFKGPLLALELYGDVGARLSHDLDILVRARDVPQALAALERAGYAEPSNEGLSPAQAAGMRRLYGELAYHRAGRLTVEPHWALAQSTQAIDLDCEAIWSRSTHVEMDGLRIASPEREDLFLMLVVHGSKELWRKLKWVADLAVLVRSGPGLDWTRALERAREAGIERMTHVAWLLIAAVSGIEMPPVIGESAERDPAGVRLARRLIERLGSEDTAPLRVDRLCALRWRMRERPRDRWRYAWRTVTTPRPVHYRIVRLPDRWIGMYVPLKLAYDYLCLPVLGLARGAPQTEVTSQPKLAPRP